MKNKDHRRLKIISVLLLLLLFFNTKAQTNILPIASPTTNELGKYGYWPVDNFHGLPQININLHQFSVGDISLPISISYHASGIKVDQEASWVGLGWSLNAGGVITRNINGGDDFSPGKVVPKTFAEIDNGTFPTNDELKNASYNRWDSEPDVFNYNFADYSGQFVVKKEGSSYNIHFLTNNDGLKMGNINVSYQMLQGTQVYSQIVASFVLTDRMGIKYYFDMQEYSASCYQDYNFDKNLEKIADDINVNLTRNISCSDSKVVAWYLTKIESPSNNTISFNYKNVVKYNLQGFDGEIYCFNETYFQTNKNASLRLTGSTIQAPILTKISGNNGNYIEFNDTHNRVDALINWGSSGNGYSKALEEIVLKNSNDLAIKKWILEYENFTSQSACETVGYTNASILNYRLKLKSIYEKDPNGTSKTNKYTFDYYGETTGESKMPYRLCFGGRDKYGYCNKIVTPAEANNPFKLFPNGVVSHRPTDMYLYPNTPEVRCTDSESGIPNNSLSNDRSVYLYNYTSYNFSRTFTEGSDPNPDSLFTRIYSLKRINYPTSGYTEFEYEPNFYNKKAIGSVSTIGESYGGGLRVKKIKTSDGTNILTTYYTYPSNGFVSLEQLRETTTKSACGGALSSFYPCISRPSGDYLLTLHVIPPIESKPVTYPTVVESSDLGSTMFEYYSLANYPAIYESRYFGFIEKSDGTWCNTFKGWRFKHPLPMYSRGVQEKSYYFGKLKKETVKDNEGHIKKITEYGYTEKWTGYIYSMQVGREFEPNYRYNITRIPYGKLFLTSVKTTEKLTGGDIINIKKMEYDTIYELPIKITEILSNDSILTKEHSYPFNFTTTPYTSMVAKNIIAPIVETTMTQGTATEKITTNYFNPSGNIYVPQTVQQTIGTTTTTKLTYNSYDDKGNVTQYTGSDGAVTTILWGYNKTYPVAKVVSGSPFTISETIRTNINNRAYCGTDVKSEVDGDITFLSQQLSDYIGNNSYQVALYTYKPLVGMTSETNANGNTSSGAAGITNYYIYDSFGRLSEVRDDEGNLLKKHSYNYANQ